MAGGVQRFLGDSPGALLVKLVFLSILVGAFMAFLDITPAGLIDGVVHFLRRVIGNGFAALHDVGRWFVYGAIIVVPLWLLSRLFGRR
jgi:hypothetical protein